jgi:hypothetical protein
MMHVLILFVHVSVVVVHSTSIARADELQASCYFPQSRPTMKGAP